MSTPLELINKVTAFSTRIDLPQRLEDYFKTALYSAHKVDKFSRDLATVQLVDFGIYDGGRINISIPMNIPRLREIRGIRCYKDFTAYGTIPETYFPINEIPANEPGFQDLSQMNSDRNYFGFKYAQLYSIAGNMLNIQGVDNSTTLLEIQGLFLPTYDYNERSGAWVTNSWIMEEAPEMVEAFLRLRTAEITENEKAYKLAAASLQQARRDLVAAYVTELL